MQFTEIDLPHLIHSAQAGNRDAMEALLRQHEALIEWVASRYAGRGYTRRQNLDDLRQDARLAFMKAVLAFRLDTPAQLKTYACRAMENECKDQWSKYFYPLTIPSNTNDRRLACVRVERRLQQELRREPTAAEIAAEVGIAPEEVRQVMTLPPVLELDKPLDPDGSREGTLWLEPAVTDDRVVGILLWRALLKPCVALLPDPEREVICQSFGLEQEPVPQQEIARQMGLNAMAVTRLKQRGLRHLREMVGGEAAL